MKTGMQEALQLKVMRNKHPYTFITFLGVKKGVNLVIT